MINYFRNKNKMGNLVATLMASFLLRKKGLEAK
jgi:hypothetical protein